MYIRYKYRKNYEKFTIVIYALPWFKNMQKTLKVRLNPSAQFHVHGTSDIQIHYPRFDAHCMFSTKLHLCKTSSYKTDYCTDTQFEPICHRHTHGCLESANWSTRQWTITGTKKVMNKWMTSPHHDKSSWGWWLRGFEQTELLNEIRLEWFLGKKQFSWRELWLLRCHATTVPMK